MYSPKQGDIVFLDFSPQSGHEQAGRRPGVVISNEQFFIRTKFAVVCPITNTSNKFPLHIPLGDRTKTTGVILRGQRGGGGGPVRGLYRRPRCAPQPGQRGAAAL